jgi:predicted transcriptional regulator
VPAVDLAEILGVTRQAVHGYVRDLKDEREKRREEALAELKRKEGL